MKYRRYKDKHGKRVRPNDTIVFDNGDTGVIAVCESPFADVYPDPWGYELGILCNSLEAIPLHQFDNKTYEIQRRK